MSKVLAVVVGYFSQLNQVDLGVNLGGGEVRVAEQFLQSGEGGAGSEQLTGKGVTQLMTSGLDSGKPHLFGYKL
jgi:hypothetical protein